MFDPPTCQGFFRGIALGVGILLGATFSGCSTPGRSTADASFNPTLRQASSGEQYTADQIRADWDDVMGAIFTGSAEHGWVILTIEPPTETSQRFTMLSVKDEPGWVLATREPLAQLEAGPQSPDLTASRSDQKLRGDDTLIEFSISLGHFGQPEMEAAVLSSIFRRMAILKGVNAAPLQ
jgi:hypothetical protein